MVDLTALQDQIKQVARARQEAQRLADEKAAKYQSWEEQNRIFLDAVKDAAEFKNKQEEFLRELTLAIYAETQNKKPCEGVGIREVTRLEYDPKDALAWAMKHQIAISLDKKSFEGFAKATPLEFVKVITEPQATISQDLTKVIE